MNQTWENGKNPIFGPKSGLFGPTLGPKKFLLVVRHCSKLGSYKI